MLDRILRVQYFVVNILYANVVDSILHFYILNVSLKTNILPKHMSPLVVEHNIYLLTDFSGGYRKEM